MSDRDITERHRITVVNTQVDIEIDKDVIKEAVPEKLYAENKDHAIFKANVKDWYYGSVLNMDM